ncbi:MAG: gluconokinase [Motilibacteraceae bacterium]
MTGDAPGLGHLVVMGVSGCGKTTLATALSAATGMRFLEADDLHPQANVAKMAAGVPLQDEDRWPWLEGLSGWMREQHAAGVSTVITCSALKRAYRQMLGQGLPPLLFVHLTAEPALLAERMAARAGHYMPPSLLGSQIDALEPLRADERGVELDASEPPERLVQRTLAWVADQGLDVGSRP